MKKVQNEHIAAVIKQITTATASLTEQYDTDDLRAAAQNGAGDLIFKNEGAALISDLFEAATPASQKRSLGLMAGLSRVQDKEVLSLFELLNAVNDLCSEIEDSPEVVTAGIQAKAKRVSLALRPVISEVNSELFDRLQDYKNEITDLQSRPRNYEPSKN